METGARAVLRFVERVTAEPELWERVLADPRGAVRAEGFAFDAQDVKQCLGIAGATDGELLAVGLIGQRGDWRRRNR